MAALPGCMRRGIDTPPLRIWGSAGLHEGDLHMPREIAFSPDGAELYLLDRSQRVQVFTPNGDYLRGWSTPPGRNGNPRGLDVDAAGRLYVADTHNSQVIVYSHEGREIRRWGSYGRAPGEFVSVTDVAVSPDGTVWTCEYGARSDRLQQFDLKGRPLRVVCSYGSEAAQLSRPQSLIIDRSGSIYVADAVNHRVQIFTSEGELKAIHGTPGERPGSLRYPYGLSLAKEGGVYVAEFGNSRLSRLSQEGVLSFLLGGPGHRPGQFDHPWGVSQSPSGEIYVADTMNYRVQVFAPPA